MVTEGGNTKHTNLSTLRAPNPPPPVRCVRLARDVDSYDDLEVYVNGVWQHADVDLQVEWQTLVSNRLLRKDRISGWRWFPGAWGTRRLQAR